MDALRAWLETAGKGTGRLVLCAGEPGIGKTRLAQEVAGIALAGGTAVVWGRCVEIEGAPAFWPWRQVLRSLGVDLDSVLEGGAASPEDRFRVFDEVAAAVRTAAGEGGLVLVLDDLHWADEPSLLVLRHLSDQIEGARLLVLATFRDFEPASALRRVLPDLVRSPVAERLQLRGLDAGEVRQQLLATAGVDPCVDAHAVRDVTGGNPLFVREVVRAMVDGTWRRDRPPRTVLDLVGTRLERGGGSGRRGGQPRSSSVRRRWWSRRLHTPQSTLYRSSCVSRRSPEWAETDRRRCGPGCWPSAATWPSTTAIRPVSTI